MNRTPSLRRKALAALAFPGILLLALPCALLALPGQAAEAAASAEGQAVPAGVNPSAPSQPPSDLRTPVNGQAGDHGQGGRRPPAQGGENGCARDESVPARTAHGREVAMLAEQSLTGEALRKLAKERPGLLESLPLHRVELEYFPEDGAIRGRERLAVVPDAGAQRIVLYMGAARREAGNRAGLEATVDGEGAAVSNHGDGFYSIALGSAAMEAARDGVPLDVSLRFALEPERPKKSRKAARQKLAAEAPEAGKGVLLAGVFPEVVRTSPRTGLPRRIPRHGEPVFGQLANYVVTVLSPASMKFAGTGMEVGRIPAMDGKARATRVAVAVRGFALVGGADWKETTVAMAGRNGGPSPTRLRVLSPPGLPADNASQALQRSVERYSRRLAAYPWSSFELSWAPLPRDQEAAAYPNAVFLRQEGGAKGDLDAAARTLVPELPRYKAANEAFLVSREAAHQWFRGIVGSDGVGDPFADEGIATMSACQFAESGGAAKRPAGCRDAYVAGKYREYRTVGGDDVPLRLPLDELGGDDAFHAIAGAKGGALLDKVRGIAGGDAFDANLRRYLKAHWFREATSEQLLEALAFGVPPGKARSIRSAARRFMDETHGDEDLGGPYAPEEVAAMAGLPQELQPLVRDLVASLRAGGGGNAPPPDDAPKARGKQAGGKPGGGNPSGK